MAVSLQSARSTVLRQPYDLVRCIPCLAGSCPSPGHTSALVGPSFTRGFHNTIPCAGSSILNLSGLSTSRESRFLAKERGIPRTEFSPHLELIRSSEVEPFTGRGASSAAQSSSTLSPGHTSGVDSPLSVAYLIKELDATRVLQAKTANALQDLQTRYKSRERDAVNLSFVTVLLIVGIANASALKEMAEPVLQRYRTAKEAALAKYHRLMSHPSTQTHIPPGSHTSDAEVFNDDTPRLNVDAQRASSSWLHRLFWASPD